MIKLDASILEEIPKIQVEGVTYTEPWCYFTNVHTRIKKVTLEEYRTFLSQVVDAGFEIVKQFDDGLGDVLYCAVLKKGEKILYMMYITWSKYIYISYSVDPYAPTWSGEDVFAEIPSCSGHRSEFHNPVDYGAGNYVVELDCITKKAYLAYLKELESKEFQQFATNEEGIDGKAFCANYAKGSLYVTVVYLESMKKMYVSACFDQPFSEHLLYSDTYLEGNKEDAKTTLHMLKLDGGGNGFVWKLKNGHFIISDGGLPQDTEILYNYLEKETPEGEIPVVEAWFISHGHADHCGAFDQIVDKPEKYGGRIFVEGIYYNEPNDLVMALDPGICKGSTVLIKDALEILKTTSGEAPKIYRTQTGQRYYFNDITVDIVVGQEQIPFKHYACDLNDSSTWCMFNVEGQKCLFGGDGDKGGMHFITCAYDQSYMEIDMFTLLHHGWATQDFFTDHCKIKTVLNTCLGAQKGKLPAPKEKENAYLKSKAEEWFSFEDGTKVMSFPYEIGSYETR